MSLLTIAEGAVKKNRALAFLIGGPSKAKSKGEFVATNKLKPKAKLKKKKGKGKEKGKSKDTDYASIVKRKDIGRGTAYCTLRALRERSMVMLLPLVCSL